MASMLSSSYKNFPANYTEMSALKKLLDSDLELRPFLLRRQDEAQAQCTQAKQATEVFADCLATTRAVKDAYAASIFSIKSLEKALKNSLNLYNNHCDLLDTISSTKGMLATWAEMAALTEALLARLDSSTPQLEAHLHLAADEHAAHVSAHIATSKSKLFYTKMLHDVDQSIAENKGALSSLRRIPAEILQQIFIEGADARQHEIITSLSSYHGRLSLSDHDLGAISKTLNLVPFTLSATCKHWRVICQSTPQLWRYARVPMLSCTIVGDKIVGKTQFEQCVLLAQKQPLELTVYPCYSLSQIVATYPSLALPAESQALRVNIVWHVRNVIPPGIPSPTELCIVASASSHVRFTQVLPTQLLANTKTLRCTGLTPQINSAVGIQTLHISRKHGRFLPSTSFRDLLQNCPQLEELHLEKQVYPPTQNPVVPFTHQQLHTLSLTVTLLPWVIQAFTVGCRFPHLIRLVLTDINALDSDGYSWSPPHSISDQLSLLTHIEVHTASEPRVVPSLRPLFEASTALCTLTLVGSAVEPMLSLLTLSVPKRVQELRLSHSDANGTTLRDYLAAIESDGGGTSGVHVVWNNCANFSNEYGRAFGELRL